MVAMVRRLSVSLFRKCVSFSLIGEMQPCNAMLLILIMEDVLGTESGEAKESEVINRVSVFLTRDQSAE